MLVALTHAFPAYGEHGLRHLHVTPAIYLTEETHYSFSKIAHMAGLGRRSLRKVPTDSSLKMNLEELQRRIAEDRAQGFAPFMVVGTGGTTAAGVIDPLPELGAFCREASLWFHVDAAWGGSAILVPSLKHYLAGIELADSITCDAHKWLSVSMGCGMFFCRHPDTVAEAFRADVSYMPGKKVGPVFDPFTNSAQWSRRLIGLKLFMALAQNGESGYSEMLEHQTRMGHVLRQALQASGWRIVNATPLPLVCFTRPGLVPAEFLAALHQRPNCLDVRSAGGRHGRDTGLHHQLPYHRGRYSLGSERNETAGCATGSVAKGKGNTMKRETMAIHSGYDVDPTTKAVAVPIYQTAAYAFDSTEHAAALFNLEAEGFRYTRIQNPTTAVLERRVAALEGGIEALCLASGQAAVSYTVQNVAELGSNLISVPQLYGTTHTPVCLPAAEPGRHGALCRERSPGVD